MYPHEAATNDPDGIGLASLQEALDLYRALGDERGRPTSCGGSATGILPETPQAGVAAMRRRSRSSGASATGRWRPGRCTCSASRGSGWATETSRGLFGAALRLFHELGDAAGLTLVFDDLASQAASDGDPERAARLWGAARSLSASTGAGLASFVDQFLVRFTGQAAKATRPGRGARSPSEGAAMTIDQVVAYALEERSQPGRG